MPSGPPPTSWRLVTARVHVSLSPQELSSSPRSIATRIAFHSLFLKYTPELGGVAVAQVSPLSFSTPAHFIDASPYAHLVATAQLLVFAPSKGVQLVGKVTYVGPDHVALSVFNVFHATLPIEQVREFYSYENKISSGAWIRKWRIVRHAVGFQEDVTVGRQMRFIVHSVKPSQSGLFQILASLNSSLRESNTDSHLTLGVLRKEEEIPMELETTDSIPLDAQAAQNGIRREDQEEEPPMHVMPVRKKPSASRARSALSALQAPLDAGVFGDVLTPSLDPGSANRARVDHIDDRRSTGDKRSRKREKKRKSVKFEDKRRDAKGEPQHVVMGIDAVAPVLTQSDHRTRDTEERSSRRKEKAESRRKKRESDILTGEQENVGSSAEKPKKKKKKKRKSIQYGKTTAVELLFGASNYNGRADEEGERKESKGALDDNGGLGHRKKEELLIEEGQANAGELGSDIWPNREKSENGGHGDGLQSSQGSKDARGAAVRPAREKSPLLEHDVKRKNELSPGEKDYMTPMARRNSNEARGADGGDASLERSRQKKIKRKREKTGVDASSEERKRKKKKRKKKHKEQLLQH